MNLILAAFLAISLLAPHPVDRAFAEGETLDYSLTWMRITGGAARITIGPDPADATRYRITSVARSNPSFARVFKVRDEIETTVNREDFSTLRYVKRLDEKGDRIEEVTTIEDGIATRTRRKVKKVPVPRPVFDPISVIQHFRRFELTPGRSFDLTLISDGKVYHVVARVVRREEVQTPAGRFSTVLVEPRMTSGGVEREEKLFIWYSDDERHLPVRIRTQIPVGSITASLQRHRAGVESADPPGQRGQ